MSKSIAVTHVRLLVNDFAKCLAFYREVVGLKLKPGDAGGPYAEFDGGGGFTVALFTRSLMAAALEEHWVPLSAGQDRAALCMDVEDVDATFEQWKARGAQVVARPADRREWMIRTAHFRDPDGNLIEINQPL